MQSQKTSEPIRILFLAAEAEPFIKVGGLGDVGGALPAALNRVSVENPDIALDIRLVLPFHPTIQAEKHHIQWLFSFEVPTSKGSITAQAHTTTIDGLVVYFIASRHFNDELAVYSMDTSLDAEKYIFFSLAAIELARKLDWRPDILHANDWHTAASIYYLSLHQPKDPFLQDTRSILTLHNLPFMGAGAEKAMKSFGLNATDDTRLPVWARHFPLALGLLHADAIVAVSPTYAEEILTPEFGCGLQDFLKTRQANITGILNGQDMDAWNPAHDPYIAQTYSSADLSSRVANKLALQAEFNLPAAPKVPLLILVSRMDAQKGVDIAVESLRLLRKFRWQAILLGSGDPALEQECLKLQDEYPDQVRTALRFDSKLSHRMYAGGDILMMPSRYEPCGLSQMNAMRYGCIPVVRATGGLKDTVHELPGKDGGTGFACQKALPVDFAAAIKRALDTYAHSSQWQSLQLSAMAQDFSWNASALTYARLYQSLRRMS